MDNKKSKHNPMIALFYFLATMMMLVSPTWSYEGDGTFYGAGGNGAQGACMLPPGFNRVSITVAMNHDQFEQGGACGRCIRVMGTGQGSGMTPIIGPIYATVDNECPECRPGDIDMGLGGDGRWRISWYYVDCSEARNEGGGGERRLRGGSHPTLEQQKEWLAILQGADELYMTTS